MNKKGNISNLLLFTITLALVGTALFVFATSGSKIHSQSEEFSKMMQKIQLKQNYLTESAEILAKQAILSKPQDLKKEFKSLTEQKPILIEGTENFFGKIKRDEFELTKDKTYKLTVNNISISAQKGKNKIERQFSICMEFDLEGNFLNSC